MGSGVVRGSIPCANEPLSPKEEFEALDNGTGKLRFHHPHVSVHLRGT